MREQQKLPPSSIGPYLYNIGVRSDHPQIIGYYLAELFVRALLRALARASHIGVLFTFMGP